MPSTARDDDEAQLIKSEGVMSAGLRERGFAALSLPHTKNNRASSILVDRVSMSIPGSELSEDDITIVMDQAHVARPVAVQALKKQG